MAGLGDHASAAAVARPTDQLPALGWAVLPILLPVLLIAASASIETFAPDIAAGGWGKAVEFLGQSQMALLLGSVAAVLLLVGQNGWRWRTLKDALAPAVGCGSKPIPWLNDSGFWIISRTSGMTEAETLKTASVMMSLMGCAGFLVVLLGAWLLPLV